MNNCLKALAGIAGIAAAAASFADGRVLMINPDSQRYQVLTIDNNAQITENILLGFKAIPSGTTTPIIGHFTSAAFDIAYLRNDKILVKSFDAAGNVVDSKNIVDTHGAERLIGFADFDGNGRNEIVFSNSNDGFGAIEIDPTNGARTFIDLAIPIGTLGQFARGIGAADVDGDGDSDLIVFDPNTSQVRYVYFDGVESIGLSTQYFDPEPTIGHPFEGEYVGAYDINGDGSVDLVTEPRTTNTSLKARVWFMFGLNSRLNKTLIDGPNGGFSAWHAVAAGAF